MISANNVTYRVGMDVAAHRADHEEVILLAYRCTPAKFVEGTALSVQSILDGYPEETSGTLFIVQNKGLPDFKYTEAAIGMDVAPNFEGYPEQCYVSLVGKGLGLDRQHAINLGLPGVMSKDMVELVRTGTMAEMNTLSGCQYNYPEFIDYIKSADVISIQLGSNDAFVPTVVSFGEATNWKSEDLASTPVQFRFAK